METPEADPVDRLIKIEERLAELEKDEGKDIWDRFQIIMSSLIPVALALAGYYFSDALADAQTSSEERRQEASQAIAESSMHVTQGQLVATFMKSLLSSDAAERDLAIKAVLLALPEAGPQLVDAIRMSSTDPHVKEVARSALEERRNQLVQDVYTGGAVAQQRAAERLLMGFREDPKLLDDLARVAKTQGAGGVYNAAVVLKALPAEQLQAKNDEVRTITEAAKQGDDRSKAIAREIEQRATTR